MNVSAASEPIQEFVTRHVFALFSGGGLALDLDSGTYSSLNASAAAVCRFITESGSWEEVLAATRRHWGLSPEQARAALAGVRDALASARREPVWTDELPYRPAEGGYALVVRGRALLGIDRDGRHLRLLVGPEELPIALEHGLRLLAPKILAAQGLLVLHASSCQIGGALTAFCGASGAGKSTVARLLDAPETPKRTDELLVVSAGDGRAWGHPEAEKEIYAWCAEAARALALQPDQPLDCAGLAQAAGQPAVPLARLIFLDAGRRGAPAFETEPLPAAEALRDILLATFLGRQEAESLRRFVASGQALGALVRSERARAPAGLAALAGALAVYRSKTAS